MAKGSRSQIKRERKEKAFGKLLTEFSTRQSPFVQRGKAGSKIKDLMPLYFRQ